MVVSLQKQRGKKRGEAGASVGAPRREEEGGGLVARHGGELGGVGAPTAACERRRRQQLGSARTREGGG
jgi:hypothetical protein